MSTKTWASGAQFQVLTSPESKVRHNASVNVEEQPPVEIPHTELSAEALRGVLESFVLREGTDYGEREYSLDEKVAHVLRQIERGEAQIMFDPATESVTLVVKR
jgi:uncharacterized protein YheU (UPF0270 family)